MEAFNEIFHRTFSLSTSHQSVPFKTWGENSQKTWGDACAQGGGNSFKIHMTFKVKGSYRLELGNVNTEIASSFSHADSS